LSASQSIIINPNPLPPIAGSDTVYCSNATPVDLLAEGIGNFTWYSDQALTIVIGIDPTLTPTMNQGITTYYVTESINGCEGAAAEVVISVEECGIIIPTAFTPDNDLTNDTWTLQNIDQIFPKNRVSIYNRWGNLLYQSNTGQYESKPWDGKYNEQELPVGTYYFIIEYNDNITSNKNGIVSILK
jgi:gliding motility-associated-like protein